MYASRSIESAPRASRLTRCLCSRQVASLYQKPRTRAQDGAFKRSLSVMASAYASAIGTCVIRHVHIPQMPPEFAKQVMLFEVVAGASEATLRNELPRGSELTAVELLEDGNACVTYSSPQHAEQAIKELRATSPEGCIIAGCCPMWNGASAQDAPTASARMPGSGARVSCQIL